MKQCEEPRTWTRNLIRTAILAVLVLALFSAGAVPAMAQDEEGGESYVRTVDSAPSIAEMEKGEGWSYNGEYIYALTRGVRDSSMPAGAKVVVFVPSFLVDTVFLPVALIFGLFGG
jgi:hypothetical protein